MSPNDIYDYNLDDLKEEDIEDLSDLDLTREDEERQNYEKFLYPDTQGTREIENESDLLMPEISPVPLQQNLQEIGPLSQLDVNQYQTEQTRLSDLMNRYKQAQEERRSGILKADLLRAGDIIGSAIAGAKRGPEELFKSVRERAELPVTELEEEIKLQKSLPSIYTEEELSNPNSEVSKLFRERVKSTFPDLADKIGDNISAKQLENLGFKPPGSISQKTAQQTQYETLSGEPVIYDPNNKQFINGLTGQIVQPGNIRRNVRFMYQDPYTRERGLATSTGGIIPLGGREEIETTSVDKGDEITSAQVFNKLDPAQRDYLINKVEPRMEKELSKFQEAVSHSDRILAALKKGEEIGKDLLKPIQTSFARLNFEVGAMSEADVEGYKGPDDILNELERIYTRAVKGQMTPADRKFLKTFANLFKEESIKYMAKSSKKHIKNIQRNTNITDKESAKVLNLDSYYPGLERFALGDVKIRNKKTGQTKWMKQKDAEKFQKDKRFEVVY